MLELDQCYSSLSGRSGSKYKFQNRGDEVARVSLAKPSESSDVL